MRIVHRFTRALVAAVLLPVALGAQAREGSARDTAALDVKAFRVPGDEPGFELNRTAFVAVFELRAGEGVSQLFPDNAEAARTSVVAGRTYLMAQRVRYNREVSRSQNHYQSSGYGLDALRSGRTVLVVASDRPLRVAGPAATSQLLRRVERLRSLRGGRVLPEDLMALIDAIKPEDPQAELVSDVLELPPA
jgi:hypothetical protein